MISCFILSLSNVIACINCLTLIILANPSDDIINNSIFNISIMFPINNNPRDPLMSWLKSVGLISGLVLELISFISLDYVELKIRYRHAILNNSIGQIEFLTANSTNLIKLLDCSTWTNVIFDTFNKFQFICWAAILIIVIIYTYRCEP